MNSFIKKLSNKKEDILLLCLLIFIGVLPFNLIFAPISFSLLLMYYILWGDKRVLRNFQSHKNTLLIALLFLINFSGFFLNYNSENNFSSVSKQVFLFLVPIIFVSLNLSKVHIKKAKQFYVLSCALFCLVSFLILFYNLYFDFERRFDYDFIQRSLYHFHFPYDTLTVNIAYIILLFNIKSKFKPFVSALFFVFIVLSGVRMGQFLFALITLIYLILNFKKILNIKSIIIAFFFLIGGILLVKNSRYVNDKFFDSLSKLGFGTEKYVSDIGEAYHNVSLREKLWKTAIATFKKSPNKALGYGPRGSKQILNKEYLIFDYKDLKNINSHNQYLTTLLDSGFLGLLVLIFIIIIGLKSSINAQSSENFVISLVIAIALFTESMLERQKGVSLFAVFFTLVYMSNNLNIKRHENQ